MASLDDHARMLAALDREPDREPLLTIRRLLELEHELSRKRVLERLRKADRLHPLIPRGSKRSRDLYRSRGAVEREFGRLKHEWALLPLRIRGLERVRLHAD